MSQEKFLSKNDALSEKKSFRIKGGLIIDKISRTKTTLKSEQYFKVKHSLCHRYHNRNRERLRQEFNINNHPKPLIGYYIMKGYNFNHKQKLQEMSNRHLKKQNIAAEEIKSQKIFKNFFKKYTQRKCRADFKSKVNLPLLEITNIEKNKKEYFNKMGQKIKTNPDLQSSQNAEHYYSMNINAT